MTSVLSSSNNNNNNKMKCDDVDQELLTGKNKISVSPSRSRSFFAFDRSGPGAGAIEHGIGEHNTVHGHRARGANCVGLYMVLTVVLLAVSVLCLELYRTSETTALRTEVDALRRDVDKLRHRLLEEDILSEYKQFEDAVYAEGPATENGDDNDTTDDSDEYPDYEEEYSESSPGQESNMGGGDHHAKHYNMDRSRKKREAHAVPVIAGSYGTPANRTEGLRLYESLVAGSHETTASQSRQSTESPVKQYHRVSPVWSAKQHRKKYRQHGHHKSTTSTESPMGAASAIISRPSRVMKTDRDPSRKVAAATQSPPQELREKISNAGKNQNGEILFRVYQEQRAVPESTVKSVDIVDVDPNHQRRRKQRPGTHKTMFSSIEGLEEKPAVNTRHRLLPAAHFNGDTSRYTQAHEHYDGNGRLRHPDGVFTDWSPSKWVQQLGMDRHFKYENGAVSIKDTGLYLVYAQIHYLDEHDINGYRVYVNEDPMLQCTTMTHSMGRERVKKSNTCFTAAALFLTENDRLSLSDIGGLRYSLFEPAKSFFGLIKLGNVNIK